ncbi:MAG: hypothetical protein EPN20_19805 [Magnetospirillum sp.]|nr:MAG: hypothetical protein EPN20_19805 [Magnetospirillum sp.]
MNHADRSWPGSKVKAPQALQHLGDPPDWDSIRVALLDTGITSHPALGPWVMADRGVNYLRPGERPYDPRDYDGILDFPGHGTKTCSVLAGLDPAAGFQGVAPRLPVVPYRVTNTVVLAGIDERVNIGQAIRHAIDTNACSVISISLGYPEMHQWHNVVGAAVDYAYEHGIIIVAGGGQVKNRFCYPGKYFRAIGVGGYKSDDAGIFYDYQGLNGFADVWAPAGPIWRAQTDPDDSFAWSYGYQFGDGTSYAVMHVAGAAAMWLRYRGDALLAKYGGALWKRVEAFRRLLKFSAQDLSALPGFGGVRPKRAGEMPPSKGNTDGDGYFVSGGLDILALLDTPLPDIGDDAKAPPAVAQWG